LFFVREFHPKVSVVPNQESAAQVPDFLYNPFYDLCFFFPGSSDVVLAMLGFYEASKRYIPRMAHRGLARTEYDIGHPRAFNN